MTDEESVDDLRELELGDEFDMAIEHDGEEHETELIVADVTDYGHKCRVSFRDINYRWWQVRGHVFVTDDDDNLFDPEGRELGLAIEEELDA